MFAQVLLAQVLLAQFLLAQVLLPQFLPAQVFMAQILLAHFLLPQFLMVHLLFSFGWGGLDGEGGMRNIEMERWGRLIMGMGAEGMMGSSKGEV